MARKGFLAVVHRELKRSARESERRQKASQRAYAAAENGVSVQIVTKFLQESRKTPEEAMRLYDGKTIEEERSAE